MEDKEEKKEETKNKPLGEGDQRIVSGQEGIGLWEQRKARSSDSSTISISRRLRLR